MARQSAFEINWPLGQCVVRAEQNQIVSTLETTSLPSGETEKLLLAMVIPGHLIFNLILAILSVGKFRILICIVV